jgi:hypothetical protein
VHPIARILIATVALASFAAAEPQESRAPWNTPVPGQAAGDNAPKDPKEMYSVEIVGLEEEKPLLIVKKGDEVLFKEEAEGWLLDIQWSPQGGYLAIDERRGNSGDYLWILDIRNRRVLKRPEDKTWETMESKGIAALDATARQKWSEEAEGDRSWGTADRWENEQTLIAKVAVRYMNAKAVEDENNVLSKEIKLHIKPEGITVEP